MPGASTLRTKHRRNRNRDNLGFGRLTFLALCFALLHEELASFFLAEAAHVLA